MLFGKSLHVVYASVAYAVLFVAVGVGFVHTAELVQHRVQSDDDRPHGHSTLLTGQSHNIKHNI